MSQNDSLTTEEQPDNQPTERLGNQPAEQRRYKHVAERAVYPLIWM